jgi:photosystem II stability/assembly factor-like uncharacterized protein
MLSSTACPDNSGKSRLAGKTLLQTLFCFLLVTQICFAQWYQQNSGTTKNLNAVQLLDVNKGFAVGDSGIIIHTTNGGNEWTIQNSGTIKKLNGLQFIDSNLGFAVGDTGTVLKTTDGGVSWVEVQMATNKKLKDVCFVNEYTGWIVGGNDSEMWPDTGIVLHTTNGGIGWTQQTCDAQWQLNGVCFFNENIGWVVGGGGGAFFSDNRIILHTTDGGINWLLQLSDSLPRLRDVCFLNNNIGWAVGGARGIDMGIDGIIIGTTDGGMTWTTLLQVNHIFHSISMVDQNIGFVVGSHWDSGMGVIMTTNDGCSTWTQEIIDSIGVLRSVSFVDAFNGWIVGDNGIILHTTNGGVSFVEEEQIDEMPTEFLLSQNYPNPFNPSTRIKYQVSSVSRVSLVVYDILGDEIETLVNEEKPAGTYEVTWYAEQLPSGIYFYRLKTSSFVETKKMILLK